MGRTAVFARHGWFLSLPLLALAALVQGPGDEPEILRAVEFNNLPVELAVANLHFGSKTTFEIGKGLRTSLSIRDAEPEKVLQILLSQFDAKTSTDEDGTRHIRIHRRQTQPAEPVGSMPAFDFDEVMLRRIPLFKVDRIDIADAIEELLDRQQLSYIVHEDVNGDVSCDLKRATLEMCLQNATRQVNATYRIEDEVVHIVERSCERLIDDRTSQ